MTTTKTDAELTAKYGPMPEGYMFTRSIEERIATREITRDQAWTIECENKEWLKQRQKDEAAENMQQAERRIAGETLLGERQYSFMDGNKVVHLGLDDFHSPLKDHPAFKDAIAKNPPFIRIMETAAGEAGHKTTQVHAIRREHFDKSLPEIFSRNLHLEGAETFSGRLSRMSGLDKGIAATNGILAAVFLYQAVEHFRHAQEEDMVTGEKKTSWSNVTWGLISASLSALAGGLAFSAVKGGKAL